jgi:hypothetical protein
MISILFLINGSKITWWLFFKRMIIKMIDFQLFLGYFERIGPAHREKNYSLFLKD